MYLPKHFEVTDRETLVPFIKENSFGILFAQTEQGPFASHLPFLYDETVGEHGELTFHMAKANAHGDVSGQEVMAVFRGPHAYISPTWYEEPDTVPTWNYTAVHAYGIMEKVEDLAEFKKLMSDMSDHFESGMPAPWSVPGTAGIERMYAAIVGYRIRITRLEGKFKLSQNRSEARQRRVIAALSKGGENERQVAALMERNLTT